MEYLNTFLTIFVADFVMKVKVESDILDDDNSQGKSPIKLSFTPAYI